MSVQPLPPREALRAGLNHCRKGEWHSGLAYLEPLHEAPPAGFRMPAVALAYLGQALARCRHRRSEAVELCERALDFAFFQPEVHFNLAWCHLLANGRGAAVQALEQGLELDPKHPDLLALRRQLGVRRPPVVRFLSRSHPVNRTLGRWRHEREARARVRERVPRTSRWRVA